MRRIFSQRYFRRIFVSYAVVLVLVVSALCGLNYARLIGNDYESTLSEITGDAELLARAVDGKFDEMSAVGVQLLESTWINKAKSHSEVLLRDLDYFAQREICEEFASYKRIISVSSKVALVLPEKEQVIDNTSFWQGKDWQRAMLRDGGFLERLYAAVDSKFTGLVLVPVNDASAAFAVAYRLDAMPAPELILTILIDGNALSNFVNHNSNLSLIRFQIVQSDEPVYQLGGQAEEKLFSVSVPSQSYRWSYEVSVPQPTFGMSYYATHLAGYVLLPVLLSVFLALGVAMLTYQPMLRLQQKLKMIPEDKNEFSAIEHSFNQIRAEQESQKRLAEAYYNSARNNLLLSLMYTPFAMHMNNESLHLFGVPFDKTSPYLYMVCILSFTEDRSGEQAPIYAVALQEWIVEQGLDALACNAPENEVVLIFYQPEQEDRADLEALSRQVMRLRAYCEELLPQVTLLSGMPHHYLMGISKSYQEAREAEVEIETGNTEQYYFPLDWEIQLISQLRAGNVTTVERIIQEIRRENTARQLNAEQHRRVAMLISEIMLRVAAELNLKVDDLSRMDGVELQKPEFLWEQLLRGLEAFDSCEPAADDTSNALGEQMQRFVEENFRDTNLTQKYVAAHFSLSCPSVSRIFKSATGKYFVDYLHTLRTSAVKDMLDSGETDLRKVSEACGYENNATFRRAFFRAFAVTPHQYILQKKSE